MDKDQLYKTVIKEFLPEFIGLFYEQEAAQLNFSRVDWQETQAFTTNMTGKRRHADLVALVGLRADPTGQIVTHIEVEGERRARFHRRMYEYYHLFWLKFRVQVLAIAVMLSGSRSAPAVGEYREDVMGLESVHFRYRVINMAGLEADDYLALNLPFAAAFASGMRPSKWGRASQKLTSLLIIARSEESEYRKGLLAQFVELVSPLSTEEQGEYDRLLRETGGEEVREMMTVYEQRGHEKGLQEGLQEGRQQERQDILLLLLSNKFGKLPAEWSERVQAVKDPEALQRMILRVMTANSLEDMELPN